MRSNVPEVHMQNIGYKVMQVHALAVFKHD